MQTVKAEAMYFTKQRNSVISPPGHACVYCLYDVAILSTSTTALYSLMLRSFMTAFGFATSDTAFCSLVL